jgi:murein DD-endopeptidase MepM/ murein hydrolase activator NlpD
MKAKKALISSLLIGAMLLAQASAVVPKKPTIFDLYDEIVHLERASEEELEQRRNERDQALAQAQAAASRVSELSSQRDALNGQLSELNEQNEQMQAEYELIASQYAAALIAKAEALDRYVEAQETLAATEQMFCDRVSVMFEYQNQSPLEILLESDSIAGFFTNIELITLIADADDQAVDQMQIALDDARAQEEYALAEANEMEAQSLAKQEQLRELEEQIGITENNISDLSSQISSAQATANDFNAQAAQLNNEIAQIQDELYAQQQAQAAAAAAAQQQSSGDSGSSDTSSQDTSSSDQGTADQLPASQPEAVPPASPAIGVSLSWPCYCRSVTSPFGYRYHPVTGEWRGHTGIDIGCGFGDTIIAAASGTVSYVCCPCPGSNYTDSSVGGGYGNYVMIDHGNGVVTLYGHCRNVYVSQGEWVSAGQQIAEVGSTGTSTGPHLHFEVRVNGNRVDPQAYLP